MWLVPVPVELHYHEFTQRFKSPSYSMESDFKYFVFELFSHFRRRTGCLQQYDNSPPPRRSSSLAFSRLLLLLVLLANIFDRLRQRYLKTLSKCKWQRGYTLVCLCLLAASSARLATATDDLSAALTYLNESSSPTHSGHDLEPSEKQHSEQALAIADSHRAHDYQPHRNHRHLVKKKRNELDPHLYSHTNKKSQSAATIVELPNPNPYFLMNNQQLAVEPAVQSVYSSSAIVMDSSNLKLEFCNNCDIYLGGLFPIHAPKYQRQHHTAVFSSSAPMHVVDSSAAIANETSTIATTSAHEHMMWEVVNSMSCGEIKKERGIQRLEAMLFAIDMINNSTSILPHVKLGAKIYDTCDRDTIALEKCMNFVSDYFLLNDENVVNDFSCDAINPLQSKAQISLVPRKKQDVIYKRKVIGVIGAASSSVSIQVANLLRLFQVPQISYASTSPELSNKERFPYFSRVLPSDTLQAEAMATLVSALEWNYVATINEEGMLGGVESFIRNARAKKICISGSYTVSQTASEEDVGNILNEMYKVKNSRAVVMFLQDHNIKKVLQKVNNLNMTDHFIWIASDSWGTKKETVYANEEVAEGAITFSPKSFEVKEFNDYFKNLKPTTNTRNPWFLEFWEEQFNCTINSSIQYTQLPRLSKRICTKNEMLNVTQDGFIHFVIDSVFAMAHAIHNLLNKHCVNMTGSQLFRCQHKVALKGPELLTAIRDVDFQSITGRRVKFIRDKQNTGDGLAPFEVFQYQQYELGKYRYEKISEWEKEKPFFLDPKKLMWRYNNKKIPRSVCKEECGLGEIKQGDDCCWVCVRCEENQYVKANRKECVSCPNGYGPDENKTHCQKLPIEYLMLNSPFTLIPIIFSSIGILMTSYCIYVFIRFNDTPIIKASGRELCYVLLAGIMLCYLVTFPLVTKPTSVSCGILRFGVSLSLAICLSALFTKTNRLSRIFNSSIKKVRQASYVSPKSQLVICFSLIFVQLIFIFVWIIVSPPGISFDYDDPKRVILQCKTQNNHLIMSFAYNIILVVLCTVYAIKTRKIPENFNEARFIGFTMYSICIIWAAFIPIYFGTTAAAGTSKSPKNNYKIQLTTLAMCLNLSGTVILFCLFLPKLRVVLLKPNKNVRQKSGNIAKAVYKTQQAKSTVTYERTGGSSTNGGFGGESKSANAVVKATKGGTRSSIVAATTASASIASTSSAFQSTTNYPNGAKHPPQIKTPAVTKNETQIAIAEKTEPRRLSKNIQAESSKVSLLKTPNDPLLVQASIRLEEDDCVYRGHLLPNMAASISNISTLANNPIQMNQSNSVHSNLESEVKTNEAASTSEPNAVSNDKTQVGSVDFVTSSSMEDVGFEDAQSTTVKETNKKSENKNKASLNASSATLTSGATNKSRTLGAKYTDEEGNSTDRTSSPCEYEYLLNRNKVTSQSTDSKTGKIMVNDIEKLANAAETSLIDDDDDDEYEFELADHKFMNGDVMLKETDIIDENNNENSDDAIGREPKLTQSQLRSLLRFNMNELTSSSNSSENERKAYFYEEVNKVSYKLNKKYQGRKDRSSSMGVGAGVKGPPKLGGTFSTSATEESLPDPEGELSTPTNDVFSLKITFV